MRETRIKKIFDILTDGNAFYTSNEIAELLGFSSKTVRNYISELNQLLKKNGAEVISKPGSGYKFEIINRELFESFLKNVWYKYAFEENSFNIPKCRQHYILQSMLFDDYYIKMNHLAEKLQISKSSLNEDLKDIKNTLSKYNLKLIGKPYKGMKIIGSELNKRNCIVDCVYNDEELNSPDLILNSEKDKQLLNLIKEVIIDVFSHYHYKATQMAFKNLLIHFLVTIKRVQSNNMIHIENTELKRLQEKEEFRVAKQIAHQLGCKLQLKFQDGDISYIAMNLISNQVKKTYSQSSIPVEIDHLVVEMLEKIKQVFSIDLTKDLDLRIGLGLHIMPLLERIKFGLVMKNPILEDIKSNVISYNVAIVASSVIMQHYQITLSEDEVGYIALHFGIAIERINDVKDKMNILIVCGTGMTTAQFMKYRIEKEFPDYVKTVTTCDAMEVYRKNLNEYDLIITAVTLMIEEDVPIIQVRALLTDKDLVSIRNHLQQGKEVEYFKKFFREELFLTNFHAENREDFLHKITEVIREQKIISKNLYQEIMKRENLCPTEFDHLIAIPHPLNLVSNETFAVVVILDKPIQWVKKSVQLILLFHLGDQNNDMKVFYNKVGSLLVDKKRIDKVMHCQTLDEFLQILIQKGES